MHHSVPEYSEIPCHLPISSNKNPYITSTLTLINVVSLSYRSIICPFIYSSFFTIPSLSLSLSQSFSWHLFPAKKTEIMDDGGFSDIFEDDGFLSILDTLEDFSHCPSISHESLTLSSKEIHDVVETSSSRTKRQPEYSETDLETSPRTKRQKLGVPSEEPKVSHITVERNRRKQMNEHLSILRSLMPCFYVKRVSLLITTIFSIHRALISFSTLPYACLAFFCTYQKFHQPALQLA